MARFLVTGRATRADGSNIVRSALVAQLQMDGHTVYSSVPDGFGIVDYLVTSNRSRNNRTMKYRWAENNHVEIITYSQMWRIINGASRIRGTSRVPDSRAAQEAAAAVEEIEYNGHVEATMLAREMTRGEAEAWVDAEQAAGNAARAQSRAEEDAEADALRRLMPEPHTIPEPGTPHNNPRMIPMEDVADSLENNRAAEVQRMEGGVQRNDRQRMEKVYARTKQEPTARPEPAQPPRRRIHVRK